MIKISLNTVDPKSVDTLYQSLDNTFSFYEHQYGRDSKESALSDRFTNLLRNAYMKTGKKIAILVDEYDAPLLDTIDKEDLNQAYRETLKSIFSVLKSSDEYIHFAFITGVSRFSHTSLFSGANNLEDISFRDDYAAICGITEDELHENLMPGIHHFAKKMDTSAQTILEMLKENYDGYHFSGRCPDIYNPFSLLQALKTKEIDNYWFKSGTPTYLLKVLKRNNFYLPQLDCIESVMSELSANDSFMSNPIALLFEAGYITIKSYDSDIEMFTLGLPNKEVATSFTEALLPIYSDMSQLDCRDSFIKMRKAILRG